MWLWTGFMFSQSFFLALFIWSLLSLNSWKQVKNLLGVSINFFLKKTYFQLVRHLSFIVVINLVTENIKPTKGLECFPFNIFLLWHAKIFNNSFRKMQRLPCLQGTGCHFYFISNVWHGLYPLSSGQPPPQLLLAFPLHVRDGLSGGLLVRITTTFIMLHFFFFPTCGSFVALHLLVPESPSFTSKSLTIVFFLNAKVKWFFGASIAKSWGKG